MKNKYSSSPDWDDWFLQTRGTELRDDEWTLDEETTDDEVVF